MRAMTSVPKSNLTLPYPPTLKRQPIQFRLIGPMHRQKRIGPLA